MKFWITGGAGFIGSNLCKDLVYDGAHVTIIDNFERGRKEYIFSFYGLIDFFATAPFYLQLLFPGSDLRFLRVFRLLRIFKLSRYNSALQDLGEAVVAERESFYSAFFLLLTEVPIKTGRVSTTKYGITKREFNENIYARGVEIYVLANVWRVCLQWHSFCYSWSSFGEEKTSIINTFLVMAGDLGY